MLVKPSGARSSTASITPSGPPLRFIRTICAVIGSRSCSYIQSAWTTCSALRNRSARQRASRIACDAPFEPTGYIGWAASPRSEEHTSELQSLRHLVCRLLLEKQKRSHTAKNNIKYNQKTTLNQKK